MKQFDEWVKQSKSILIIASRPLDFDSLGSGLVLKKYLESLDKKVTLMFPRKFSKNEKDFYSILPFFQEITEGDTREALKRKKFDLLIMVDGSNLIQFYNEDLGSEVPNLDIYPQRIHIDHHLGHPENLGTLTIRDPKLSSAAEVIFQNILPKNFIKQDIATLIYAAILGDTGNFRWNFYPSTLETASFLLSRGAQPLPVIDRFFCYKTKEYFQMLSWAIKNSEYEEKIKAVFLFLPYKKIKAAKFSRQQIEYLKLAFKEDFSKEICGHLLGMILVEEKPGIVHISARGNTLYNKVNLPEMFLEMGGNGGGHFNASGTDIPGDFTEVKKLLIKTITKWQKKN